MATNDRVTQQNQSSQLADLDAEQAFLWLVEFIIDRVSSFGALLVRSAMDADKPDVAEQIKREFPELVKSTLSKHLRQAWGEFSELWPQLQPVLYEIKNHGIKEAIDHYWSSINETLNSLRERGYISPRVSNEELLADVLQGEQMTKQVPPGHPLLQLLGVENEGEWNKLTPAQQQVVLFYVLTERKYPFLRLVTKLLHRWAEDSATNSVSQGQMVHNDEVLETIEAKASELHEYLSDAERLSQFCELAGIDMSTLTDGDLSRILDILHALDMGYDFASKQGVSMQAYYGDKADSEKTQRQRLFKKVKKASDKAK